MTYRGPGARQDVFGAAPGCVRDRCQLKQAADVLEAARQIVENGRRTNMSQALWCDQGGHAFSERDPGRQRISITVLDEETNQERGEARDFCGDCAQAAGLLSKSRTRPGPAAPALPRADPRKIADLETELGFPRND
jgi:hypothetical protein